MKSNNDNLELLDFINKKCECDEVAYPSQLMYFYSKSIKTSLINTFNEQKSIELAISCAKIISNIFKIIYTHSLNLKLSMFTCERAVLLFNEYINISKSYQSENINIIDIKQFIINKSIGPIILKFNKTHMDNYSDLFETVFKFLIDFFIKFTMIESDSTQDLSFYIETLIRILSPPLIELYDSKLFGYIDQGLLNLINLGFDNVLENINLFKIKFEIFMTLKDTKGANFAHQNIASIMEKENNIKKLLIIFNEDENIKDSQYFKNIITNI